MKKIFFILIILSFQICKAQFYHYRATITPSKQEVSFEDTLDITYSVGEIAGYHYVAVWAPDFDLIGKDSWEGLIQPKETRVITFKLKLKNIDQLKFGSGFISVNLGLSPFKGITNQGFPTSVTVKLKQRDIIKDYMRKKGNEKRIKDLKKLKIDHPVYYDGKLIIPDNKIDSTSLKDSTK